MTSKGKQSNKKSDKDRVKVLNLKRETIKDLTRTQKKNIKGGGGLASGVVQSRTLTNV